MPQVIELGGGRKGFKPMYLGSRAYALKPLDLWTSMCMEPKMNEKEIRN